MNSVDLKINLESILKNLGYDLYSLSYKKEHGEYRLEVIIDRVEPIDLNQISLVSEKLSAYLDEVDPFKEPYTLDVCSLGVEKPVKKENLHLYQGKYVNVHLINPVMGENIIEGELSEVTNEKIVISVRIKTRIKKYETTLENVSKARLAIKL